MKYHSIKFNFLMNFILKVSTFVFPLVTFPYVTRILSPDGIGKVSFATAVVSYLQMFAMLGIPTYGLRAAAKVREDKLALSKVVQELGIMNLITTAISYAFFLVLIEIVPTFKEQKLLLIITSANLLLSTIGFEWLYTALEQYTYITVRSLVFKVLSIAALFMLVHKKEDYIIYASIAVVSGMGSNIFNLIHLRKFVQIKPIGDYNFKVHIKPIIVLFAMAAAGSVYTHLDTMMLGFMTTDTEIGYYTAAVKIKNILLSLIVSLGGVLLPRLTYYVNNGKEDEFDRLSSKALNIVFYLSVPVVVYFSIFAPECIGFLSGAEFAAAVPAMIAIMPTILFIGLTNMLGYQILVPTDQEHKVLISTCIGAVVDVIVNALLIKKYGALGASIGTLVAEAFVLIVQCVFLRDYLKRVLSRFTFKYAILPTAVAALISIGVRFVLHTNDFIMLVVSSIVFFAAYTIVMWMEREPISRQMIIGMVDGVLKKIRRR